MPLFYSNKQSFGDADIVVVTDGFNQNIVDYITNTFKPNEIFHNGNCWSFDYKELQIDLITVSEENFYTYCFYLSYNDLGNFIGRIAHGFGLKYGEQGLWYEHYFKGMNIGRIPISKNYYDIFNFLGLSYERYLKGFNELEEIFEFISSSKYFNWRSFQLDKLNKINRDRNKKRTSYMTFLKWMDDNVANENHEYKFDKTQEEYNKLISTAFPYANLDVEIKKLEYEYCKSLYVKAKFSGKHIMDKYGLKDAELGKAIEAFKTHIRKITDYDEYIINTDINEIYSEFEKIKQQI